MNFQEEVRRARSMGMQDAPTKHKKEKTSREKRGDFTMPDLANESTTQDA